MSSSQRDQLRQRFGHACGYCGVTETAVGALLTVDHFQPRSQGGGDEIENLVYACHACNEFKGDFWQSEGERRVLHPLRDEASTHLQEADDGMLRGLTLTGTFHIERLRLNRPALLEHRRARNRLATANTEQSALLHRLAELEDHVQHLTSLLEDLERA